MADNASLATNWWIGLTPQWKQAFAEIFFLHSDMPTEADITRLLHAHALRFAGPTAPYPNMSFELTDLSGIRKLTQVQVLIMVHHSLETIQQVSLMTNLRSLFVNNNRITSLAGVEDLLQLEQLYAQGNSITSLVPVQKLINLKELYVNDNVLSSFDQWFGCFYAAILPMFKHWL